MSLWLQMWIAFCPLAGGTIIGILVDRALKRRDANNAEIAAKRDAAMVKLETEKATALLAAEKLKAEAVTQGTANIVGQLTNLTDAFSAHVKADEEITDTHHGYFREIKQKAQTKHPDDALEFEGLRH